MTEKPKAKTKSQAKTKSVKAVKAAKPAKPAKAQSSGTGKSKKPTRKKTNLLKLCAEMNKLGLDANDKEIIKRFKIIIDTCDDDITKAGLDVILKEPKEVDLHAYHESFQPYIKHYLYMLKRSLSKKN